MAKKAGAQKLQEDIQTDEELNTFLERPGLLVLDIYSGWCGPCLGMVGSLRKIKLDIGGDNLSYAICKSDNIEAFKRFRRKSEPTWLFVTNKLAVNIMFGTNVPKLMEMIYYEMDKLKDRNLNGSFGLARKNMHLHEIPCPTDYQPEELARRKVKEDAIAKALAIEAAAKEKKRIDYLTHVTDIIMENLSDMGVTIFGPQVSRDLFKKITEQADLLKIQCKDRKNIEVSKVDFETIHFNCPNPITTDVLEQLEGKELLVCFWKVPGEGKDIPKLLNLFAQELQKSHTQSIDEYNEEEIVIPPLLKTLEVKVEVELQGGEVWVEESNEELPETRKSTNREETRANVDSEEDRDLEEEGEEQGNAENHQVIAEKSSMDINFDLTFGLDDMEEEAEEELAKEAPKTKTRTKKIHIPPIWVANNHRTHAALIYMYFRNQTTGFLPPDPKPEPPYVVMAFDAYKKRDLILHAERYKEDVPCYGFFTSDDADEAKFIANSLEKYKPQTTSDKIVLKVKKSTSHTMLQLVTYGPTYVSPNTTVGHEEALKFFPATYKTSEQDAEEQAKSNKDDSDKNEKKKTKKSKETHEQTSKQDNLVPPAAEVSSVTESPPLEQQPAEDAIEENPASEIPAAAG